MTAAFPPGAIVVAYTDGVVEARRGGEQFGDRAARRAARRAPAAAGAADRRDRPRGLPGVGRQRRAHRRLRRGRDQAVRAVAVSRSQLALAALVFGAGTGSLATEIAASRLLAPVLRLVDDRLGEPDRHRARGARVRLLARRPDRRPAAGAAAARPDRARRGGLGRADAVRRPAVPRRDGRQPRRRLRGRGDRLVLRRPPPVLAGRRRARDGLALRDPPGDHGRRDGGRGGGSLLRALDRRLAARHVRARADRDSARRHAADAARNGGAARALGLVPPRTPGAGRCRRARRARRAPAGCGQGGGRASCTRRTRSTSSSRSSSARTATGCSGSTRASRSTRSGGRTPSSPAASGTRSSSLPPLLDRPLRSVAIFGNAGGTIARALGVVLSRAPRSTASSSIRP